MYNNIIALSCLWLVTSWSNTRVERVMGNKLFTNCEHYDLRQQADEPQPGMHILCLKNSGDGTINISLLKDGHDEIRFVHPNDTGDDFRLFTQINELIGSSNNRSISKWKAFNTMGKRMWSVDRMLYEEVGIIFTNGLWMWPGVRPGYTWTLDEQTVLTTLSLRPLVFMSSNFLTDEECDNIISDSEPHLIASKTSKMDKDRDRPDTDWRTSSQYFIPSKGNPIVEDIDWRVAHMTKTLVTQQEYVQVLRYEKGQKYDQHTDYFDARFYEQDPETLENIKHGEKNRLITVLWYLSNITDGGQTVFPKAFGDRPANSSDCSAGLRVTPIKGSVVVFYSLTADGGLDPYSVHGACPVGEGVKWAANKWIWTESTGYYDEDEEEVVEYVEREESEEDLGDAADRDDEEHEYVEESREGKIIMGEDL